MKRRISVFLLTLLLSISVFPMHVHAYDDIDTSQKASLTVSFIDVNTPVVNAAIRLYQIASVDSKAHYSLSGAFVNDSYDINGLSEGGWETLARNLYDEVIEHSVEPVIEGTTGTDGMVSFSGLDAGMYLVTGWCITDTTRYTCTPYLIALPDLENDQWMYEVTSNVKYEKTDISKPVDKTVLKVWDDADHESDRPESIQVQLYDHEGSKISDPAVLSSSNNWTYTWKDLDGRYAYTAIEVNTSESYTASKETKGNVDQITNTYKNTSSPSKQEELPFTGIVWWPIPLIAIAGLGFYLIGCKQKKDHE